MIKGAKTWESMRKCAESLEIVLKVQKVWESVLKSSESVSKPEKVWESVLKVEKVC